MDTIGESVGNQLEFVSGLSSVPLVRAAPSELIERRHCADSSRALHTLHRHVAVLQYKQIKCVPCTHLAVVSSCSFAASIREPARSISVCRAFSKERKK
jgi:hypothetical protein